MLIYLINPTNKLNSLVNLKTNQFSKYRIWKPLGLMAIAAVTPSEWKIIIIDENIQDPDYLQMPLPDLVGITAFTSQATRAYEIAAIYRNLKVTTIMGGIHASLCVDESIAMVDTVVTGEADIIWPQVLKDYAHGALKKKYSGSALDLDKIPSAKHNLMNNDYKFGSIQTTRGCPLNCNFCSVTVFNGKSYRHRPIEKVIEELKQITEKYILIVDDNFIGTQKKHIERAKDLLKAIIQAKIKKKFIAQTTINLAEDKKLLHLAQKAGFMGVFIGFETHEKEGLKEINKSFNLKYNQNLRNSVRSIQKHGIGVVGSFILGLDVDQKGIGKLLAQAAIQYGIDVINPTFLTPFPGTELFKRFKLEDRLAANNFPDDWKYYTLTYPVAKYMNLSWTEIYNEMNICRRTFFSLPKIILRMLRSLFIYRKLYYSLFVFITNLGYRVGNLADNKLFNTIDTSRGSKVT